MSEEQKVDNRKLAGWKRAILIAVPFILLSFAIYFMVEGILAWGPDFTRNHGDTYLALSLVCTILLFVGIAMQFVWPKAINRGRRIVVVGLVFNIILAISAVIVTGVGYGVNSAKYLVYETKYKDMTKRIREGLDYESAKTKLVDDTTVTVEQFIKDLNEFNDKNSAERATVSTAHSVSKYENYSTEAFYKEYGYDSFAYKSQTNVGVTVEVYNLYMGDADLKAFAEKYNFSDAKKELYGEDYKLENAPQYYEAVWTQNGNTDASKIVKAKFDSFKDVQYLYSFTSKTSGKTVEYTMKYIGLEVLFDYTAKAARILYANEYAHWYSTES